jgi:hypothetical protein
MYLLNKSLQGPGENALTSNHKILGFKRKLCLCKDAVKGNPEMFPLLLGLEGEEGFSKFRVLLKTTMKNCGTKLNIIFSPFQHK